MTLLELPRSIRDDSSLDRRQGGVPIAASLLDRATQRVATAPFRIPCGWSYLAVAVVSSGLWWGLIHLVLAAFG